jgi:hypothetical protein
MAKGTAAAGNFDIIITHKANCEKCARPQQMEGTTSEKFQRPQ